MEVSAYDDYEEYGGEADDVEYLDYYDDELYELPEEGDAWEEEDETVTQFSTAELYEFCVVPTFSDSVQHLGSLLLWSFIFTLTTRIVHLPAWLVHLISAACGCMVAWQLFGPKMLFMVYLILAGTLALFCSDKLLHSRRGPWTCGFCVAFLILCELWWADPVEWHSIRGAQMIILMKIVSVGYDLDATSLSSHPSILEMAGYIMNPGTIIFGPWTSFDTYRKVLQPLSIQDYESIFAGPSLSSEEDTHTCLIHTPFY
ncbi:protein-serine O-palmitoleoyltransferase porcupine-like [Palaemon carinicauda]|uniref:protein-serine O-palmitoleoyltransferase porcupine-like n=1 Tax=Palaemon carinicauda TaxID=392227 RepID=UPI0035B60549